MAILVLAFLGALAQTAVSVNTRSRPSWLRRGGDIDGDAAGDELGAVSLSQNGTIVAVGMSQYGQEVQQGKVRVLQWSKPQTLWVQLGQDIDGAAAGDFNGWSLSLSSNGTVVAIGSIGDDHAGNNAGNVRVFGLHQNRWVQLGDNIDGQSAGDQFGRCLSIAADGESVAIASPFHNDRHGQVRVFRHSNAEWHQLGAAMEGEAAPDNFGQSVSLSSNGSVVAVGGYENAGGAGLHQAGHVRVFRWSEPENQWLQLGSDIDGENAGDLTGTSVSISNDGSVVAVGARGMYPQYSQQAGHVRVFRWSETNSHWTQMGSNLNGDRAGDQFGRSVSISSDGFELAVGARFYNFNPGSSRHGFSYVRNFRWTRAGWVRRGADIHGESRSDLFGNAVSLAGNGGVLAVVAPYNDGGGSNAGHARVFEYPTASPTMAATTSPTLGPSAAPTSQPTRHACNDGSHGCNETAHGICVAGPDNVGYTCSCASTHRCSDGDCITPDHICIKITTTPASNTIGDSNDDDVRVTSTAPPPTGPACPRNCGSSERGGGTCHPNGWCLACNSNRLRVLGRCFQAVVCKGRRIQSGSQTGQNCRCIDDNCHFCNRDATGDTCRVCRAGTYLLAGTCIATCPAEMASMGVGQFKRRCQTPFTCQNGRLVGANVSYSCKCVTDVNTPAACQYCNFRAGEHGQHCTRCLGGKYLRSDNRCHADCTGTGLASYNPGNYGRECRAPFTCTNRIDEAGNACKCSRAVGGQDYGGRTDCLVCEYGLSGDSCVRCTNNKFLRNGRCVRRCQAFETAVGAGLDGRECR